MAIFVPAFLIFYTIGWRKTQGRKDEGIVKFLGRYKGKIVKYFFSLFLLVGLVSICWGTVVKLTDPSVKNKSLKDLTPTNYHVFEAKKLDFDKDGQNELLLLFEESDEYLSNPLKVTEGFRSLNTMYGVYEQKGFKWELAAFQGNLPGEFFFTPSFNNESAVRLYETDLGVIFTVFTFVSSFDGPSYKAKFLKYESEQDRVVDLGIPEHDAFSGILEVDNTLYYSSCNPFMEQEVMNVIAVYVRDYISTANITNKLNIQCEDYYDLPRVPGESNFIQNLEQILSDKI